MSPIKKFEANVMEAFRNIEDYKIKLDIRLTAEPENFKLQAEGISFNRVYEQALELKRIAEKYSKIDDAIVEKYLRSAK